AAHTALDLPERGAVEAGLTDGRLRLHVRVLEREETWAPRYVGDELAATHLAAQQHRENAELWAARAAVTDDPTEAQTLRTEAERARAEADVLAERAAQLEVADQARAAWYAATAATRDAAERARAELKARGVDLDNPGDQVTAEEWLAAHRAEQLAEDPHREVRDETELTDETDGTVGERPVALVAETDVPDVRDTTIPDVTEHEDTTQHREVLTADETAAAVARAQTALAEIAAREQADTAREAEHAAQAARSQELTRWAEQDRAAEAEQTAVAETDDAFVLDR
nr:TrwC relaxase [Actinomycetota bacterium]